MFTILSLFGGKKQITTLKMKILIFTKFHKCVDLPHGSILQHITQVQTSKNNKKKTHSLLTFKHTSNLKKLLIENEINF